MLRILISGFFLLAVCDPALAQQVEPPWTREEWIAHIAITVLGCFIAVHLALQAFARPVQIANAPTFPKYMTSPRQYRLGSFIFIVFACSFFLLLVFLHRHVVAAASVFQPQLSPGRPGRVQGNPGPEPILPADRIHHGRLVSVFAHQRSRMECAAEDARHNSLLDQHSRPRQKHR